MFTVALSIPRRGSLDALVVPDAGRPVSIDCGAVVVEGGVAAGPEPAGPAGFTASSLFHMSNLHLSENSFRTFAG
jgi:hypothetical protein